MIMNTHDDYEYLIIKGYFFNIKTIKNIKI